ncbi:MAG: beta-propeller fold lactonase family protein, partial [Patescibacteria group bacterium]|nr:beta-propeller fold lactonase family protein [Patescibacteria group bacterium]
MNQLRRMIAGGLLAYWGAICPLAAAAQEPSAWAVYIGTRGDDTRGIFRTVLNATEGTLTEPELVAETTSPAFLAIHPNRRFLYAVGDAGLVDGNPIGAVIAFAIDPESGKLARLNHELSGGRGPCHLIVDQAGRNVLVANYWTGTAAVLPIEPDGRLRPASSVVRHTGVGVHPKRQTGPHAHSINLDPANRFAFVADLGLDQVFVYR